jgi:hypothetical protein
VIEISIKSVWVGPPKSDGGRPGPKEEFFERKILVDFVPSVGDTLMLRLADGSLQDIDVAERVLNEGGGVAVWVGPLRGWDAKSGWDRDDVASLFHA